MIQLRDAKGHFQKPIPEPKIKTTPTGMGVVKVLTLTAEDLTRLMAGEPLRLEISATKDQRIAEMTTDYINGASLEEVGQKFGLTRERVRLLIGMNAKDAKQELKRRRAEAERVAYQDQLDEATKLRDAKYAYAVERYIRGDNVQALCYEERVHNSILMKILREQGIPKRRAQSTRKTHAPDPELDARYAEGIKRFIETDESCDKICKDLGLHTSSMNARMRKQGVPKRNGEPRKKVWCEK